MKRFFILGDSWAIGEYRYQDNTIVSLPNTGIGYYLEQLGHSVTNIAKGGASNYDQLLLAQSQLTSDFDYVIWFHTETTRDIISRGYPKIDLYNFPQCMTDLKTANYNLAEQIYKQFQVPFIVVGCLSNLDETIETFEFAKIKIYSWLNEITESAYQLPSNMHQDIMYDVLMHYENVDKSYMNKELNQMKFVERELEKHKNFTDGVHPCKECSKQLAIRLNELV